MAYLCPHPCDGKTEYGYCRYTWCINPLHSNFGTAYQGQGVQKCIITNGDKIRASSDEELANEFAKIEGDPYNGATIGFWLDWLRQEADDDNNS